MLACAESNFSNFKFEYLRENEFLRKTILACLSGAQMGSIHENKRSKISWHCPFKKRNFWKGVQNNLVQKLLHPTPPSLFSEYIFSSEFIRPMASMLLFLNKKVTVLPSYNHCSTKSDLAFKFVFFTLIKKLKRPGWHALHNTTIVSNIHIQFRFRGYHFTNCFQSQFLHFLQKYKVKIVSKCPGDKTTCGQDDIDHRRTFKKMTCWKDDIGCKITWWPLEYMNFLQDAMVPRGKRWPGGKKTRCNCGRVVTRWPYGRMTCDKITRWQMCQHVLPQSVTFSLSGVFLGI